MTNDGIFDTIASLTVRQCPLAVASVDVTVNLVAILLGLELVERTGHSTDSEDGDEESEQHGV